MQSHPVRRSRPAWRAAPPALAAFAAALLLSAAACSGSAVRTYRTFQSAVDRGASCSELFDQRARFHNQETLTKVDAELGRIGCTSRDGARTDR